MDEINKLRKLYNLKKVYRHNSVEQRHESTAEHTWSAMILADYFYDKYNYDFDLKKVFELLLYHDIVEIEIGDAPLFYQKERQEKKKLEFDSAKTLNEKFPEEIKKKYINLFEEYEKTATIEANTPKQLMHWMLSFTNSTTKRTGRAGVRSS